MNEDDVSSSKGRTPNLWLCLLLMALMVIGVQAWLNHRFAPPPPPELPDWYIKLLSTSK